MTLFFAIVFSILLGTVEVSAQEQTGSFLSDGNNSWQGTGTLGMNEEPFDESETIIESLRISDRFDLLSGRCETFPETQDDLNPLPGYAAPSVYRSRTVIRNEGLLVDMDFGENASLEGIEESGFTDSTLVTAFSSTGKWRRIVCEDKPTRYYPEGELVFIDELIIEAWKQIEIDPPIISMLPNNNAVAQLKSYYSVDSLWWEPKIQRVEVDDVWVEVTFVPDRTSWNPGEPNGVVISCPGRGTHDIGQAVSSSRFSCGYVYSEATKEPLELAVTTYYLIEARTNLLYVGQDLPELAVTSTRDVIVEEFSAQNVVPT